MKRSREEGTRGKSWVFNVKIRLLHCMERDVKWLITDTGLHSSRKAHPFYGIDFSRNWFADCSSRWFMLQNHCEHTDDMCSQTMRAETSEEISSPGDLLLSRRSLVEHLSLCVFCLFHPLHLDFAFSLSLSRCSPLLWSLLFSPVSPDSWILKNHWKEHFCEYL